MSRLKLAAVDLDGTLLGPDLSISPENFLAFKKLQSAGLEVALASGRHYHSMRPFADRTPPLRWMVSSQGGEVSDLDRTKVVHRAFIEPAAVAEVLDLGHRFGVTAMLYAPEGIFTESDGGAHRDFYARLAGCQPVLSSRADLLALAAQKISWVGSPESISALAVRPELASLAVPQVRTHARLYEFLPVDANKGTGVAALAAHLGFKASEVVAFGDAENDIPMFVWAGTSVAMPHGWPAALASASLVGPAAPLETAFARAVDQILAVY